MTPHNNLSVQIAMRIKEVESTNQHYMYDTVCQSLVHDFIHSNSHMTLVAYGPYNNGKSYTLIGDEDGIETESSKGILPRLVYDLMNRLVILTLKTGVQYLYYVSFIEIYNDIVIDLLNASGEAQTSFVLDIDELGYTHIHGVSKVECASYEDVVRCLKIGLSRRNTKDIDNHVSSLSHVVFTFHVYTLQGGRLSKYNKLIFIDLTSNESENLIEESIHGYNEYYNSSYQIIYDVIANNQFVVPNYFTAIHKYLQDAFNANIVRKHKNQIDFVSNHMKTVVLCCISNEPLYARDVHNCVSLLSYIYNLYSQSGSPMNASEQISKEVFINYLRNKQMGEQGMGKDGYAVGDIPGRVVGSGVNSPGHAIENSGVVLNNGGTPSRNGVDNAGNAFRNGVDNAGNAFRNGGDNAGNAFRNGVESGNTWSDCGFGIGGFVVPENGIGNPTGFVTRDGLMSNTSSNINGNSLQSHIHCDNSQRESTNLGDGTNILNQPSLYQYQQFGWNGANQNMSSHTLGNFVQVGPRQGNVQNSINNENRMAPNDTNGLSHNPNEMSQHHIDVMHNRLNNIGKNSTFHHNTTTNSSYPGGTNQPNNGSNANHVCFNKTNVPNLNQNVPNFNQGVSNTHQIVPTFNQFTNTPVSQCPTNALSAFSTPFHAMPDNHIRANQTPPNGSPCERKTTAIETRKRSTCRPSLCKIDEETDNVEDESEKESSESSSESEPRKSDESSSDKTHESDAYNSSLASNSLSEETNEVVEEGGNESLDDINEDLRSDDEAICTDSEYNELCDEKGATPYKDDVRDGSNERKVSTHTDVLGHLSIEITERDLKDISVKSHETLPDVHSVEGKTSVTQKDMKTLNSQCVSPNLNSVIEDISKDGGTSECRKNPFETNKNLDKKLERVDTENDTSGVFSANVQGFTDEMRTEEITDIKTDEMVDDMRTDDEVTSDMSEDEEDMLDDTKSIPTSEVGSDEEMALLKQEELQRNEGFVNYKQRTQELDNIHGRFKTQSHEALDEPTHQIVINHGTHANPSLKVPTAAFVQMSSHHVESKSALLLPQESELESDRFKYIEEVVNEDQREIVDERSELDRTSETEDSEEETDEEEEEHVNELMVKTELEKIYTELEEKIEILNGNYLRELLKNYHSGSDQLDLNEIHTRYENDPNYSNRHGISHDEHTNESCYVNSQTQQSHLQRRPDVQITTSQQQSASILACIPRGYNQVDASNFGANHNQVQAYINDNLIVQRPGGDNQVHNVNVYSQCSNLNRIPRDDLPQHIISQPDLRYSEALTHHHRNYETRTFGNSSQLPSSHLQSTLLANSARPDDNQCLQESVSPQQMVQTRSPVNSSFVNGGLRTALNTGQPFPQSPLNAVNNLAVFQGNTHTNLTRSPPFQTLQNHPSAFQAFVTHGSHPMSFFHNQPIGNHLQSTIPMVQLGVTHPSAAEEHAEMSTNFSSVDNQYSKLETQPSQLNSYGDSSQRQIYSTDDCVLKTSSKDLEDHFKIPETSEKVPTRDCRKRKDSKKRKSGRTSESDPADSKESGKERKRKSRHKRDSTHSSGDRTNESGGQKGKKLENHKVSYDSLKASVDEQYTRCETIIAPHEIEDELLNKMKGLKVNGEPSQNVRKGPNAPLLKDMSHLENTNNLVDDISSLNINEKVSTSSHSIPSSAPPYSKPVSNLKRSNSQRVSKKASSTSDPYLDNVLSSCEFQHVWNDIDTKKSQMNVILLDLDTASERINELKQLINLKNHLLKFLVNNKPLRDEVRHKLDTKTVQLKLKLKKLKHNLYEMKHMEEKMNIEKLNLKFKKNRNGSDANKQLILFNHLNRMKHDEEPSGRSNKKGHRRHRDMDRHSSKVVKLLDDDENVFPSRNSRALINNQSLGTEPTLGALVTKYAASNEARLAHEFTNPGVYESDEDPLLGNDNTLPASIASLKAQIEATDAKLHNLEVITKITMQSDEQIDELNKNLSKWTKILTTFEKLIETEKVKKEQLKNDLVLNLYKIKSMEETFGRDRHKEEVLHEINNLIEKMNPNHTVVDAIKTEKDVTESDKTIKPDSNSSSATVSKTFDAKVEETVANVHFKSKDEGRQRVTSTGEVKEKVTRTAPENPHNETNVQIHDVPKYTQCRVLSTITCCTPNPAKEPETVNKSTDTGTQCDAVEIKNCSNLAETSSQTDHEMHKLPTSSVGVESSVSKAIAEQQVIDEYNKEVLQMAKQANKKSNVIETLMNGSDKKLDNLLETESSIDTLGSTSIRNYKINNSTEISDNAISMAAISDKSAGATPGFGEKRKKKSSLSRAFSFRKNTPNSTGSGACPSMERSSEKPEKEKSTTGKKIKNFILNKSGDKNKSNDSIRFKKPDDQVSNCSNQSNCLKNSNQNVAKDDDKLSNSSLASKLKNIVESSSTRDVKVNGDDKKHVDNAGSTCEQMSKGTHACSGCRSTNQTTQCTEQSHRDASNGNAHMDAKEAAKQERKAKRDALKCEIEKLLELKQVIVEKRMKLFPSKCQEQSEVARKLFFEYDESIETIDVLIEYKGNLIRDLDGDISTDVDELGIYSVKESERDSIRNRNEKCLGNRQPSNACKIGQFDEISHLTVDHATDQGPNAIVNRRTEISSKTVDVDKKSRNNSQCLNSNVSIYPSGNNCSNNHPIHSNNFSNHTAQMNILGNIQGSHSTCARHGDKNYNNCDSSCVRLPNNNFALNGSASNTTSSGIVDSSKNTPVNRGSTIPNANNGLNAVNANPTSNNDTATDGKSVPNNLSDVNISNAVPNHGTAFQPINELYTSLVHKLISLNTNDLIHIVLTYFRRIIDLRSTTIEFEKLVQNLDFKLEMKITNLQEMNLKFERLLQNNQISNEKHLTLLQKDYQNKLHLFYKCYCNDHVGEERVGGERAQSVSPTASRPDLSETLLLKEENKFLKNRVKFLEAQLRKKDGERGGYELVPSSGQQVGRVNQLGAISSNLTSNKTITVENNKLVISRRK